MKAFPIWVAALTAGAAFSLVLLISQPQPQHEIVSAVADNSSLAAVFENATNLTNNGQDSVYGQIAAWNSSVFVLWQDSVDARNYDIFIKKSDDNGTAFGSPVNLSNNTGLSEHPQLAAYGSNVYAAWADNTPGNREVLLARSTDGGASYGQARNISNNTSDSHNQEMAASGDNVYLVWVDQDEQENTCIMFRASNDGGATFGRMMNVSSQANFGSFPKVAAYGDDVYLTWNVIGDETEDGLYFVKSSDSGNTFGNVTKLGSDITGESQVAAYNNTIYIVSGGLDYEEVNNLFFLKSIDSGETFDDSVMIDANGKFVNPTNVEVVSDSQNAAYVAGQVFSGGNEEILLMPIS